jgi:hypothetical protein
MLYAIGHGFFFADDGRPRSRGTIGWQAVAAAGQRVRLLARDALRPDSIQEPYLASFYGDYV